MRNQKRLEEDGNDYGNENADPDDQAIEWQTAVNKKRSRSMY